ncbi:MAG: hypothetical protein R3F02_10875 [Thiolinea sp.]
MSYNKPLMLATGVLLTALTSSNAYAVNCSISYYCYRSMTPGEAPEAGSQALARRTAAASNRVLAVSANNRRAQPATAGATQTTPAATPRTLAERQAEAQRREQEQRQRVAEQRRRAQQLEQQRLAEVQRRRQQASQSTNNRPAPAQAAGSSSASQPANTNNSGNARADLIAAQRNAYQAEQRRLAELRRRAQQGANRTNTPAAPNRPATTVPARPSILTSASQAQQSCQDIERKITALNRQAVLRSQEKQYEQAQRLFKAVEQLQKEAGAKNCPDLS